MSILGGMITGLGKGLSANQELAREQEAKMVEERKAASLEKRENMLLKLKQDGAINFISDPKIEALVQSQTLTPQQGVQMQVRQTEAANNPDDTYRQLTPDEITQRGLDPAKQYQVGPKQRVTQIGGSGTSVTVNNGPSVPEYSKLPAGYVYVRDQNGAIKTDEKGIPLAAPIAGGPADIEAQKIADAAVVKQEATERSGNVVLEDIDRALKGLDKGILPTSGAVGGALSGVPGTQAYDVGQLIETIKANSGFDRLQAMRDSSPTGGALGAINQSEMGLLQAAMGNLSQSQSEDQLKYNLERVKQIYNQIINGPDAELESETPSNKKGQTNSGVSWSVE